MNLYFTKVFTFLHQEVDEIAGGSARPPLGIQWQSKTLGIRRAKEIYILLPPLTYSV